MYFEAPNSNFRLAGTMHVFPKEFPAIPEWLWQAYDWAEVVVFESFPETFAPHCVLKEGTIADYIPADLLEQVASVWDSRRGKLELMKPWFAGLALPTMLLSLAPGVEIQIRERAAKESKPTYCLEDGADVARALDEIPQNVVCEQLRFITNNQSTVREALLAMHAAWLAQDLGQVLRTASRLPLFANPVLREVFVTRRNNNWLPRLCYGLESPQRVLFLVGALHLCGDESLPELIESDGYRLIKVTR